MPRGFGETTEAMAGIGGREAFFGAVSAPGYAVLEREIDAGGRFTLWSSRDSQGPCHSSAGKATPCGSAFRPPVAERAARAGSGATPRPEGLLRLSDECGFTPSSLPSRGRSRTRDPLREGHERVGLTGAATSDSEPKRPVGTADPPWHGGPRQVRRPSGRQPAIREPRRERGPVRGRGGGAPLVSLAGDMRSVAPASMLNSLSG